MDEVNALVEKLVANQKFGESDREWLAALGAGPLKRMVDALSCRCNASQDAPTQGQPTESTSTTDEQPKVQQSAQQQAEQSAQQQPRALTRDEWLALATQEDREMFESMRAQWDAENARMREEILKSRPGIFTADELASKSRAELQKLHALACAPKPDYSGAGLRAQDGNKPASNAHAAMPALPIKINRAA